jgi:hypothetical protein
MLINRKIINNFNNKIGPGIELETLASWVEIGPKLKTVTNFMKSLLIPLFFMLIIRKIIKKNKN